MIPACFLSAHVLSMGWERDVRAEAQASALYPATAACQGGSVAASLVDSYEFRTADKCE